ncbi:MAG: TetR/AcrR family transcriptional regulator [Anaerolineales bacterium]|nr:TetR/AcrR family transcriptional regulator [Anaerolineales bacterium]
MAQVDRRVRRTKKSLEDALIALALEKEYDEITIQEITERADIGYRTFFRHYSDKDVLLKEILSTMMMELRELMVLPPPEIFADPNVKAADLADSAVLFRHVQKHSDLYRVLLRSERTFFKSVMAFAIQGIEASIGPLIEIEIPIEVVANHIVSATFALVRWWLDSDMSYSPETMGEYSFRLIMLPIRDTILQSLSK